MTRSLSVAPLLLSTLLVGSAVAAPITVQYQVRVTSVFDPLHLIYPTPVTVGDILTGTYTFDSDAVDIVEPEPFPCCEGGLYKMNGAPYGLTLNGGPSSRPFLTIEVFDFDDADNFNIVSGYQPAAPLAGGVFAIMLADPTNTALVDDSLIIPDASAFAVRSFQIDTFNPTTREGFDIHGEVISFQQVNEVPEPGTLTLLAFGLAAARRWRGRN